jgi:hypothetical protein
VPPLPMHFNRNGPSFRKMDSYVTTATCHYLAGMSYGLSTVFTPKGMLVSRFARSNCIIGNGGMHPRSEQPKGKLQCG